MTTLLRGGLFFLMLYWYRERRDKKVRNVKVTQFVKTSLEDIKEQLQFRTESEAIYYLLRVYDVFSDQVCVNQYLQWRESYQIEKEAEDAEESMTEEYVYNPLKR